MFSRKDPNQHRSGALFAKCANFIFYFVVGVRYVQRSSTELWQKTYCACLLYQPSDL